MRESLAAFFCILIVFNFGVASAEGAPKLTAKSAALVEASTGRLLYGLNEDKRLPMASTTKVMTALVAIEHGELGEEIVIPPQACGIEGSSMYLEAGEKQTLENLLYGLMLRSGNDAATAIALHIGGTVTGFAQMMNDTAVRLGCENTRFVNPHGLPADGHYTTASDLARIAAYAMCNPVFSRITSTERATVPWDGKPWDRAMVNKNKLLYTYEGANGVKTGYTKAAGRCLVAGAVREDMQLVSVVLSCGPMYEECADLLDFGFESYDMRVVLAPGTPVADASLPGYSPRSIQAEVGTLVALPMREDETPELIVELDGAQASLVERGDALGGAIVRLSGMDDLRVPLVAVGSARNNTLKANFERVMELW